jgi:hypothetical protein
MGILTIEAIKDFNKPKVNMQGFQHYFIFAMQG